MGTTRRLTRLLAGTTIAAPGVLAALAGCGGGDGDDGGATADDYTDAIVDVFEEENEMSAGAQRCLAAAYVDAIGVDGFRDAGVTPDDIRDDPEATPEELGIELDDDDLAALSEAALSCPEADDAGAGAGG